MDGVLDGDNDMLPELSTDLARPYAWYKTTISCFRLTEFAEYYSSRGWVVSPLLVIRDVRSVWSSLSKKPYGRNGITAEDPPWRIRLRRFHEDWLHFSNHKMPIIRYESFVAKPLQTLRDAVEQLGIPWQNSMIQWSKPVERIAVAINGNANFTQTRQSNLLKTLQQYSGPSSLSIPRGELEWLEHEFRAYNQANGYPEKIESIAHRIDDERSAEPTYDASRRSKWELRRKPLKWAAAQIGFPPAPTWKVAPTIPLRDAA